MACQNSADCACFSCALDLVVNTLGEAPITLDQTSQLFALMLRHVGRMTREIQRLEEVNIAATASFEKMHTFMEAFLQAHVPARMAYLEDRIATVTDRLNDVEQDVANLCSAYIGGDDAGGGVDGGD